MTDELAEWRSWARGFLGPDADALPAEHADWMMRSALGACLRAQSAQVADLRVRLAQIESLTRDLAQARERLARAEAELDQIAVEEEERRSVESR